MMFKPDACSRSILTFALLALATVTADQPLAQRQRIDASAPAAWSKGDHDLASAWLDNLKTFTDQLDDCTYKGRFSNLDSVPDRCNGAYFGALNLLAGHQDDGLLNVSAAWLRKMA
jgi:hypothetical protein